MQFRRVTTEERKKAAKACFGGAIFFWVAVSIMLNGLYVGLLPFAIMMGACGSLACEIVFSLTPADYKTRGRDAGE